jgi:hypothetical protein
MERTLPLNPSLYTLHLDIINPLTRSLLRGEEWKFVHRNDVEAWRRRVSRSLKEILAGMCPASSALQGGVKGRNITKPRCREAPPFTAESFTNGIEARRISIETLAYPFEWIEDMVSQFGFSICLDIGHILTHGYDLGHYLKNYLPRTSIVHLHGVHKGSDHLGIEKLPEADLNLILSALRHYHGIVSIEVFSINALKDSLAVLEEKWIKG